MARETDKLAKKYKIPAKSDGTRCTPGLCVDSLSCGSYKAWPTQTEHFISSAPNWSFWQHLGMEANGIGASGWPAPGKMNTPHASCSVSSMYTLSNNLTGAEQWSGGEQF